MSEDTKTDEGGDPGESGAPNEDGGTREGKKSGGVLKKILLGVGGLLGLVLVGGGGYVGCLVSQFNSSTSKVYEVPVPDVKRSEDEAVIARGEHISVSLGACATADCHGTDLAGGKPIEMGPLGVIIGPNITPGGRLKDYSDGELFRLIRHAIRNDGRTVQFMPVHEINWLPDKDITALLSYLRTVPASDKANPPMELGLLAKILDRREELHIDIARRIDHDAPAPEVPEPAPTKAYGSFVARNCTGCHGGTLSGGPIPGAPPSLPVPVNITPHDTGIKDYTYDDFIKLLDTGVKRDGKALDPFMPYKALAQLNEIEKKALWAYLRSVPAKPFGGR